MGLKSCSVVRGQPLDSIRLTVQGYNTGTVRVTSDACGVEYDARYTGGAEVRVPLHGLAQENCLLAISVQPEFPGERDSAIVIGSLKAFVRVRVLDAGDDWRGYESKISEGASASIAVPAAAGILHIRGCGAVIDQAVIPLLDAVSVDLPPLPGVRSCVYEGVILGDNGANTYFTWMVWRHRANYVPPPIPHVAIQGGNLTVMGEPAVTAVGLDGEYHVGQGASMSFDPARAHVIRALTVGGRNILGEYEPGKEIQWKR